MVFTAKTATAAKPRWISYAGSGLVFVTFAIFVVKCLVNGPSSRRRWGWRRR